MKEELLRLIKSAFTAKTFDGFMVGMVRLSEFLAQKNSDNNPYFLSVRLLTEDFKDVNFASRTDKAWSCFLDGLVVFCKKLRAPDVSSVQDIDRLLGGWDAVSCMLTCSSLIRKSSNPNHQVSDYQKDIEWEVARSEITLQLKKQRAVASEDWGSSDSLEDDGSGIRGSLGSASPSRSSSGDGFLKHGGDSSSPKRSRVADVDCHVAQKTHDSQ